MGGWLAALPQGALEVDGEVQSMYWFSIQMQTHTEKSQHKATFGLEIATLSAEAIALEWIGCGILAWVQSSTRPLLWSLEVDSALYHLLGLFACLLNFISAECLRALPVLRLSQHPSCQKA